MINEKIISNSSSEKLNQLRTFSTLWIFIFHYYHFILHPFFSPLESYNPFLLLVYHGHYFVYVFFSLSGYLLAIIYQNKLNYYTFFKKRILRILPAYYLCLVGHSLVFGNIELNFSLLFYPLGINPPIKPNTIVYLWFINRLLLCYLCFPLLFLIQKKIGSKINISLFAIIIIGSFFWNLQAKNSVNNLYGSYYLCFSHFLFATIIGFHHQQWREYKKLLPIVVVLFYFGLIVYHQFNYLAPLSYSVTGLLWFHLLPILIAIQLFFYTQLNLKLPRYINILINSLAHLSYEIYLYNFLIIQFVVENKILIYSNKVIVFFILFIITLVLALFSKLLIKIINSTYQIIFNFFICGYKRMQG